MIQNFIHWRITKKYSYRELIDNSNDELPFKFRHVCGLRSVKPEYYVAINRMKSECHMSEHQAQGAVCIIMNEMLERKSFGEWKQYKKGVPS